MASVSFDANGLFPVDANGLLPAGQKPSDSSRVLLFCNGIANEKDDAVESAKLIAAKFKDVVYLLYNDTSNVIEVLKSKDLEEKISLLKTKVESALGTGKRVFLFAHSHGTLISFLALAKITDQKNNLEDLRFYGFGGAVLLPHNLGGRVTNYVNGGDLVSLFATKKLMKLGDPQIWKDKTSEDCITVTFVHENGFSAKGYINPENPPESSSSHKNLSFGTLVTVALRAGITVGCGFYAFVYNPQLVKHHWTVVEEVWSKCTLAPEKWKESLEHHKFTAYERALENAFAESSTSD